MGIKFNHSYVFHWYKIGLFFGHILWFQFRLAKRLAVKGPLFKSMSLFANDTWKDRDDAARKCTSTGSKVP